MSLKIDFTNKESIYEKCKDILQKCPVSCKFCKFSTRRGSILLTSEQMQLVKDGLFLKEEILMSSDLSVSGLVFCELYLKFFEKEYTCINFGYRDIFVQDAYEFKKEYIDVLEEKKEFKQLKLEL